MPGMDTIRLLFAGDFCSKSSTLPITVSEELQQLLRTCDLRIVNFEVPLRPEGASAPSRGRELFYQNDDAPGFLRNLGFDLFSMANNHAFDWGDEGFLKTKAALGDAGFGAGTYEEAYKVKVVDVRGVRIGFLALSFAAYAGVFCDVTKHGGLGCAYINDLRVNHIILEARKELDYLFILPHDGVEYIDVPLPETMARYRDFIDYGADGVIGTHPHCPQGWEIYQGKPIFYSLGNFLFNSKDGYDYRATNRPHWYEGLCVLMTITDGKLSWEVVNTRNVDNLGIEVDRDEKRDDHNRIICKYLADPKAYEECLESSLEDRNKGELKRIRQVFLPRSSKEALKTLWMCMRGRRPSSLDELAFLMKNDLRKSRMVRMLEDRRTNR